MACCMFWSCFDLKSYQALLALCPALQLFVQYKGEVAMIIHVEHNDVTVITLRRQTVFCVKKPDLKSMLLSEIDLFLFMRNCY